MNIALLCALIIVTAKTDGFHVQNERTFNGELGQGIFLRKLQASQQDDPKETKTVPWNKILADVLVSHIKISSDVESITKEKSSENCFVDLMSHTMKFFKIFVYDRFLKPFESDVRDPTEVPESGINKTVTTVGNDIEPSIQSESQNPTTVARDVANTIQNDVFNIHPKSEVEILDSVYHGKLKEEEIGEAIGTVSTCPDGLVVGEDGSCTNPKSKFILSIPFQCPDGYRRDWVGICRPRL